MNKSDRKAGVMLLEARGLFKHYTMARNMELPVLKGIDLQIRSGEIVAVVGRSGAGKSTLLHILGALDRPSQGQVFMAGTDIFRMGDQDLAQFRNAHVGFVFQFHHLLPEFTALENVAMPGLIGRASRKRIFERAASLLEEVGLQDRMEHRPRELSGGEQQRVAFARALTNDPDLILADEPSGNLDLRNSQALHDLMWNRMQEKGKTFIVVTHNPDLASRADRVLEIFDGGIRNPSVPESV